jgi:hypothetical protein
MVCFGIFLSCFKEDFYPHKLSNCLCAKYDRFFPIDENADKQQSRTYALLNLPDKRTELLLKNTVNFTFSLFRISNVKPKQKALMLLLDFITI